MSQNSPPWPGLIRIPPSVESSPTIQPSFRLLTCAQLRAHSLSHPNYTELQPRRCCSTHIHTHGCPQWSTIHITAVELSLLTSPPAATLAAQRLGRNAIAQPAPQPLAATAVTPAHPQSISPASRKCGPRHHHCWFRNCRLSYRCLVPPPVPPRSGGCSNCSAAPWLQPLQYSPSAAAASAAQRRIPTATWQCSPWAR